MNKYIGVPYGMKVVKSIMVKRLKTGMYAEVCLVMHDGQFEAALFLDDKFKAGPPIPYPLDTPNETNSHWMGVRPSVGLSPDEAALVLNEVECENSLHKKKLVDRWDKSAE